MNTTLILTDDQARELADNLTHFGPRTAAEITLPSGDVVRATIDYDYGTTINDFDCYGKVFPVSRNTWNGRIAARPAECDGAAEIITFDRGESAWWQPPVFDKADRRYWHTNPDYRRKLRSQVRDLLDFGFYVLRVELCRGTDVYGRPIVIDFSTLAGIEPFTQPDHMARLIGECAAEIGVNQ